MTLGDQPAFPDSNLTTKPGMTYRMWLVGQIANGINGDPSRSGTYDLMATEAIKLADAIIKRLEEEGK